MLRLVTPDEYQHPHDRMAAQVRELAAIIESGRVEHAIVVGVIDGSVSYAPIGTVTLVEATGLLELASRKIERDLS